MLKVRVTILGTKSISRNKYMYIIYITSTINLLTGPVSWHTIIHIKYSTTLYYMYIYICTIEQYVMVCLCVSKNNIRKPQLRPASTPIYRTAGMDITRASVCPGSIVKVVGSY